MSFAWSGFAVLLLPTPGGKAPEWIKFIMSYKPPYVPAPIIFAVVIGLVVGDSVE